MNASLSTAPVYLLGCTYPMDDAKLDGESCAITAKLCKKKLPKDVKALHRRLRDHGDKFRIAALKTMENATYRQAHAEEKKMKAKHSNLAA